MKDIIKGLASVLLFAMAALANAQLPMVKVSHLTYDIVYDYNHFSPAAVLWVLQESDFRGTQARKPKHFKMDYRLPPPRVKNDIYTFSRYQRGHLCPSGDRDSRKDWFRDTYYTSNILPMTPELNAGAWKEIERFCRMQALAGCVLRIAAGPVWLPRPAESNTYQVGNTNESRSDSVILTPAGTTIHELQVPDAVWKIARCIVHENHIWSWICFNQSSYISGTDCQRPLADVLAVTHPTLTKYIESWIRK